ncbi:hypothetical protein ACFXKY_00400 [Streptomyces canus]|uniref:hypothetical protein n=1 Tax=Streptomyces canus TaxID=58343 RepID=UPI0036CECFDF
MTNPEPQQPTSLEVALQWGQLPPEHLKAALKALEPELARQYELSVLRVQLQHQEVRDQRVHHLYMGGLIAGFIIVVAMLTGAVIVGINQMPWLAAMLSGPSVLALAGLFVLRRIDSTSAREMARSQRASLAATQYPDPSAQPTQGGGQGGVAV